MSPDAAEEENIMKASLKIMGQTLIIAPVGDLDHHTVSDLRERIDKEARLKNVRNILFDFSKVEFMDSSGIGLIIGRYKLTGASGGITAVCHMKDSLRRIFEISGLKKIIQTYKDVGEALAQIQSQ